MDLTLIIKTIEFSTIFLVICTQILQHYQLNTITDKAKRLLSWHTETVDEVRTLRDELRVKSPM